MNGNTRVVVCGFCWAAALATANMVAVIVTTLALALAIATRSD